MNIGFMSMRVAVTDGVTPEMIKWAEVCRGLGHGTFFCVGQLDATLTPEFVITEARFAHPEMEALVPQCFGVHMRLPETMTRNHQFARLDPIHVRKRQKGIDCPSLRGLLKLHRDRTA